MNKSVRAVFFPSFDGTPEIQAEVPSLWLPFGLDVEIRSPVATQDDYETWLEETAEDLPNYLIGASNGGKIALSLLARNPSLTVVVIAAKESPYNFENPLTRSKLPNLAKTSDVFEKDQKQITPEMYQHVLSLYSQHDEMLDVPGSAQFEYAHSVEMPTDSHGAGIAYAVERCGLHIAQFCLRGIVPKSV